MECKMMEESDDVLVKVHIVFASCNMFRNVSFNHYFSNIQVTVSVKFCCGFSCRTSFCSVLLEKSY